MFDKLQIFENRFEELNQKLYDPSVVSDPAQYQEIMKETSSLQPLVEKYREFQQAKASYEEARALLDDGGLDKDFREMVQEELDTARAAQETLSEELKILLLPKDPNDERNVIVEIRGGAGGEEAALFCGSLYRMYSMYAQARGWQSELVNASETELGGYKEVTTRGKPRV